MPKKTPTILIIMDGCGISRRTEGNAFRKARKPHLDHYLGQYPCSQLQASGLDVGLPRGTMGNSEVGHLNIGAGRVVNQALVRINKAIEDGSFFSNHVLLDAIKHVKKHNSALHFMGLLSDAGVHSHISHLWALMKLAKMHGITNRVYLHAFLDGRDVPPKSAEKYIKLVYAKRKQLGINLRIGTIIGRYYGMDRDNRWKREHRAYISLVEREGYRSATSLAGLKSAYERGETDEFVKPTITDHGTVEKDDAIIFFNFRADRTRQITRAFTEEAFDKFHRDFIKNLYFVCLTDYDKNIKAPVAFPTPELNMTLAEFLSRKGLKQFHTAETEKYAHVTFFFNGGREEPLKGEDRKVIPSPKVATYDLKPEMSAYKVTAELLKRIKQQKYDFIVVNFANGDMVGHTGRISAAVKAVETVDACVGRVIPEILKLDGNALIIADHGNCEWMREKGKMITSHSTNPVPCCLVSEKYKDSKLKSGRLADVAPTLLQVMGLKQPKEMTGKSLIS